jgi:excisionase family DNA binding protein
VGELMEALIDVNEAARLLGLSAHTVRSFVSTGKIAHRRLGGAIRFTRGDVEEFVEAAKKGVRCPTESDLVACPPLKWVTMPARPLP